MGSGLECGAAVLGIIQLAAQMAVLYQTKYRAYKRAEKDLQHLRASISMFSTTLHCFGTTMHELIRGGLGSATDARMRSLLVDILAMAKGQTKQLWQSFDRLRALADRRTSSLSRFGAKIMWIFVDARDMKELLASLEPIKSTMNLLLDILKCDLLLREIDQLRRDNQAISEDMVQKAKSYMGQIKMLKKDVKEKQRQYDALRTHSASNASNSFPDLARGQSIREIVVHIQGLATERISDSRVIMKDIGREATPSTSTETGSRDSTTPSAPAPAHAPLPPQHELNIDGSGYPSASRESGQDINSSAELSEISRDGAMEVELDVEEIVSEQPTVPGPSGPNISAAEFHLQNPTTVSNTSLPQEQPVRGSGDDPSPRYRFVIRNGKMVPKTWRGSGDDANRSDVFSSDSE